MDFALEDIVNNVDDLDLALDFGFEKYWSAWLMNSIELDLTEEVEKAGRMNWVDPMVDVECDVGADFDFDFDLYLGLGSVLDFGSNPGEKKICLKDLKDLKEFRVAASIAAEIGSELAKIG